MKRLLFMLLMLSSLTSFGQETKEAFINAVYQEMIGDIEYYYLCDTAHVFSFDSIKVDDWLKGYVPDSIRFQVAQHRKYSKSEKWDSSLLQHAIVINQDSCDRISNLGHKFYHLKKGYRRNRKVRAEVKALNEREAEYWQKGYYSITNPVFDDRKEFALISYSCDCGFMCGFGCTYLYQKTDNIWKRLAVFVCWGT